VGFPIAEPVLWRKTLKATVKKTNSSVSVIASTNWQENGMGRSAFPGKPEARPGLVPPPPPKLYMILPPLRSFVRVFSTSETKLLANSSQSLDAFRAVLPNFSFRNFLSPTRPLIAHFPPSFLDGPWSVPPERKLDWVAIRQFAIPAKTGLQTVDV